MQNAAQIYENKEQAFRAEQNFNSNVCWFCDSLEAEKAWAADISLCKHYHTQFGLMSRTHEYLTLDFKISCCRTCHRAHKKAHILNRILTWLGVAIGFIAGLILPLIAFIKLQMAPDDAIGPLLLLFIACGTVLGGISGYLLSEKIAFFSSPKTKPKKYAKKHPLIAPLIKEGWGFGKPL